MHQCKLITVMSKTWMLLYVLFVVLNCQVSLGSARQDSLVPDWVLPDTRVPWSPYRVPIRVPKEEDVDKQDLFYNSNAYDYYQPSDDLPHRERIVYSPYEFTRFPIHESMVASMNGSPTTNWKNFLEERGGYEVKPYRGIRKRSHNRDTPTNKYSEDEPITVFRVLNVLNNNYDISRFLKKYLKRAPKRRFSEFPLWETFSLPDHNNINLHPDHPTFTANNIKRKGPQPVFLPQFYSDHPTFTENKMKRNGPQPNQASFLHGKTIQSKRLSNEKEEFMKQLYYDLFN